MSIEITSRRMLQLTGAAVLGAGATFSGVSKSRAQSLEDLAKEYGRVHGGAIYCDMGVAHDFGVAAMEYFQRIGGGQFERLREIYGLTMIDTARTAPTGGCEVLGQEIHNLMQKFKDG